MKDSIKKLSLLLCMFISVAAYGFSLMHDNDTEMEKGKIIEMIINNPELKIYLHPEVRGRIPVVLIKNSIVTNEFPIKCCGKRVKYISEKDSTIIISRNYLEFTEFKFISGSELNVSFSYPIEGIRCEVNLKKDKKWKIIKYHIVEY